MVMHCDGSGGYSSGGRWWEMVGGGFWMIHDEWWEMVGDGGRGILDAEQLYKMVLTFFQKNEKLLCFLINTTK